MSLVSDYHSKRTRSRAMSFHQSSVYAGSIAGSWFAAWAAEKYGWRLGFYVFGGLGMVLAAILYLAAAIEPYDARAGGRFSDKAGAAEISNRWMTMAATAAAIFRKPTAILLLVGFMLANFVAAIFLGWAPSFLSDKFHFDLGMAGLSGTVFIHGASALAVPVAGLLADRLSMRMAGGRILVQAAGLLVGSVFVFYVGRTTDVTVLIVSMTAFGICKRDATIRIFLRRCMICVEPRARASAAGIMNTVGWGAGAMGPAAFGWLADHGSNQMPSATTMGGDGGGQGGEHERCDCVERANLCGGGGGAAGGGIRLRPAGYFAAE